MSNQNTDDSHSSTYLNFSDGLVAEVRRSIEEEFEASAFSWLKFRFRGFAKRYIKDHFDEYLIVSQKRRLEEILKKAESDYNLRQLDLRSELDVGKRLKETRDKKLHKIENEINQLLEEISRSHASQEEAAQDIRRQRIEDWYQYKLEDQLIKPSTIPGIGPTRVAALDYVNIRTAADIIPENETKGKTALLRVRGANPNSEWYDLENWRDNLKQRMSQPIIKEPTQAEIQSVIEREEARRKQLISELEIKKNELESLHTPSSSIGQQIAENLRAEQVIRERMTKLKNEMAVIQDDLNKYENITPEKLLEVVLQVEGT